MAPKAKKSGLVIGRGEARKEPLGALQAIVLKKLDELGDDAFGFKVLETLIYESGHWFDPSLVYATIRKLADKKRPLIEQTGTRPSPNGGPPVKIFKVTAAGRALLKETTVYYRALTEILER